MRAVPLLLLAAAMAACQGGRGQTDATPHAEEISHTDLATYVDPRIGSFPPGFTSPGAALPHGLVAAGPDTEGPFNYGGYSVNNLFITGFSQTHMSAGVYQGGQIPLMPISGQPSEADLSDWGWPSALPFYASNFNKLSEQAEPGYYRVDLLRYAARAEITATQRAALHRYTWQPTGQPGVVLEPSRDLKGHHPASLHYRSDGVISGRVDTRSPDHSVYFALRSDTPYTLHTPAGEALAAGAQLEGENLMVVLRPQASTLQLKIGLSYVDEAGALNNLDQEMPHWDFQRIRDQARATWNQELARIQVTGAPNARLRSFYTALYRSLKFPNLLSDVDGRYRLEDVVRQDQDHPRYTQFSLWDSYRGHSALLAEIVPQRFRDMVMSMVEYAEVAGQLPRWQLANRNPGYMSGDPAVMFVGEAWCRGLLDAAQREQAWAALLATVTPRDEALARGYLPSAQPNNLFEAISGNGREAGTTLEYGLADFALAAMARARGDDAVYQQRLAQSLNYRNLLDPQSGWIRPRDDNGAWATPFQPEYAHGFQEGTSWQYSWLAQHDYAGLFAGMNAVGNVEQRLDTFFGAPLNQLPLLWPAVQNQITLFGIVYLGNQYAPGNEHDLQAPYAYNYLGAPHKTQIAARAAASLYTDTALGMPGNDDLGALSGWLVWTMLGVYPINPGLPHFVIGSPEFASAVLKRPTGDFLIAREHDGYISAAQLDDASLVSASFVLPRGASTLSLQTSQQVTHAFDALPPSISTHPIEAFGCIQ